MKKKPEPVIISRISADQLNYYKDKVDKIVYLCDGEACKRNCKEVGFGLCMRTAKLDHAVNKDRGFNAFELSQYYEYKVLEELEEEPSREWIPANDLPKSTKFICSHCQKVVYGKQSGRPIELPVKTCDYPFCPYCQSPMKPYYKIAESKNGRPKK